MLLEPVTLFYLESILQTQETWRKIFKYNTILVISTKKLKMGHYTNYDTFTQWKNVQSSKCFQNRY